MSEIANEVVKARGGVMPEGVAQLKPLKQCCRETVEKHAANNPMMVCGTCKQIIKCFTEESAYRNYLKFCQSRHREVLATEWAGYRVVVFSKV